MRVAERDPEYLKMQGFLERVEDVSVGGRTVLASRLGFRITPLFVDRYLGRIFETPGAVFPIEMLQPEQQDRDLFAEGVDAIVESQRRVALLYFEDGSVESACPPLKALLHIMARGDYQGAGAGASQVRALFERETLLASDWYQERLRVKQERDRALWLRHAAALERFRANAGNLARCGLGLEEHDLEGRIDLAASELERVTSPSYLEELRGTIGADPFHGQMFREALE
jgi:hypothetical protein